MSQLQSAKSTLCTCQKKQFSHFFKHKLKSIITELCSNSLQLKQSFRPQTHSAHSSIQYKPWKHQPVSISNRFSDCISESKSVTCFSGHSQIHYFMNVSKLGNRNWKLSLVCAKEKWSKSQFQFLSCQQIKPRHIFVHEICAETINGQEWCKTKARDGHNVHLLQHFSFYDHPKNINECGLEEVCGGGKRFVWKYKV